MEVLKFLFLQYGSLADYLNSFSQMVQDITYEPGDLTCAGLSPVKTLVTLGSTSGQLVVNKYPLHMAQKFTAFPAHSGSLNKVFYFYINVCCINRLLLMTVNMNFSCMCVNTYYLYT